MPVPNPLAGAATGSAGCAPAALRFICVCVCHSVCARVFAGVPSPIQLVCRVVRGGSPGGAGGFAGRRELQTTASPAVNLFYIIPLVEDDSGEALLNGDLGSTSLNANVTGGLAFILGGETARRGATGELRWPWGWY